MHFGETISLIMDDAHRLSTVDILRIAKAHFTEFSFDDGVGICKLSDFFNYDCFGLSANEIKDVELGILLLASAEKVSCQQFTQASKILRLCDFLSTNTGNSVQRLVHYFTKAIQKKINCATGATTSWSTGGKEGELLHLDETIVLVDNASIAGYLNIPIVQVSIFAGVQAIVESVPSARKVHLIDIAFRNWGPCMLLMQALAARKECQLEHFKITAVGMTLEEKIEETGKRLACFAVALNIPFSFKAAMVTNLKDVNGDAFESHDDEAIVIYSWPMLRRILAQPDCLEYVTGIFKSLNPSVMVLTELQVNHFSLCFMGRFFGALSFQGAAFDCVEDHMNQCDSNRMILEATYFGPWIQNIVSAEDEDGIYGHMKIDAWRTHLENFGLVETELSSSSLFQAELRAKMFAHGNSCTLNMNGKSLIVNWKGTPIVSVSAGKFNEEKDPRRSCKMKCKSLRK